MLTAETPLKTGTVVEVLCGGGKTYLGRVLRWTKAMGPRSSLPEGFTPVREITAPHQPALRGLMIHRSGLRVVSKREAA